MILILKYEGVFLRKLYLNRSKFHIKNPNTKIFLGLLTAIFLGFLICIIAFVYLHASFKLSILFGIIAFLVTLWTNRALPMGVVSLLPIILFPSFEILDTKSATSNYANPIIFLFLGGFMIATATEKIGLHRLIAKVFLSRFPKTPQGVILALGLACVILGTALSNSTVALLLLPVAMSITQDDFLKTRFLLTIAFASSISGISTPISSPPNLIYLGFLENLNIPTISFTSWIIMMVPLSFIMLFIMIKILSYKTASHTIDLSELSEIRITKEHKRLLFFLLLLLCILFINSPIRPFYDGLGLNENLILLAFGLAMFLPKIGFLNWADSRSIPFELVFLFGASFCIAMAFQQAELGGAFEQFFSNFKNLPFLLFILIASIFAVIGTSFLSTTAFIAIILPIINVATAGFLNDTHRILTMLIITISSSFSFMMPISTPPNAMVFNQGGVSVKDMAKFGFILTIAGVIIVLIFSNWYWRLFIN